MSTVGSVAWTHLAEGMWAGLRELCGHDEQSLQGVDTPNAIRLLDRLLVHGADGCIEPGTATQLTASGRDRLLATLHINTYGARIDSALRCDRCDKVFDLDFSLQDTVDSLHEQAVAGALKQADGTFLLPDGRRFRLPTGEDECAVWRLPADQAEQELLARCLIEGDPAAEPDAVEMAMAAVAPLLDLELVGSCPECGADQLAHFDIQSYLLASLHAEQDQLALEVHRLAMAYGWSLSEILSISRCQRRKYVALIERDLAHRPGRIE